jgi:hypothetical protein
MTDNSPRLRRRAFARLIPTEIFFRHAAFSAVPGGGAVRRLAVFRAMNSKSSEGILTLHGPACQMATNRGNPVNTASRCNFTTISL